MAGRLRKRGGELIGVDRHKLRRELDASMHHVFAAASMPSFFDDD